MRNPRLLLGLLLAVSATSCKSGGGGGSSGGSDPVATPSTYVATGGEGDLIVWVVADGGADVSATVTQVDEMGNPIDGGAFTVRGACNARDTTFDYRTCTVSSVTPPRPDGGSPMAGDQFYTLELPGVAYLAHPAGDGGANRHDLHVGIIAGSCGDFSGTYNMVHVGPPGRIADMFGQFTLTGTAAGLVTSVSHWDYGFVVNGQYSTRSNADPIRTVLTTGNDSQPAMIDGGSCTGGVVRIPMNGGEVRATATSLGALLVDLQRGKGGIVGIRTTTAATLDDLKGRRLVVLAFNGENDGVKLIALDVDADAGMRYVASTTSLGSDVDAGMSFGRVAPLSDSALASVMGTGNLLDSQEYSSTAVDGGNVRTWRVLDGGTRATAPAPAAFNGFFTIVDDSGRLGLNDGSGQPVFFMAQKSDAGIFISGGHLGANSQSSGFEDGGYTRCFVGTGRANDRQQYCVDGPFVGFAR